MQLVRQIKWLQISNCKLPFSL